eukprot:750113-Hanusia_phi.AAC.1
MSKIIEVAKGKYAQETNHIIKVIKNQFWNDIYSNSGREIWQRAGVRAGEGEISDGGEGEGEGEGEG